MNSSPDATAHRSHARQSVGRVGNKPTLWQAWLHRSVLVLMVVSSLGIAQDKKPDTLPQLLIATPLGVVVGQPTKVVLRGKRLDEVKELRLNGQSAACKVLSKGKTGVPQKQDVNRVGDSQLEIELTAPLELKPGECELIAVSDAGVSVPFSFFVDAQPLVPEKEPNDGFRQAQEIKLGDVIEGTLHQPQNVDVFRFEATAGEKIVCEVIAARRGSALDASLTLFDSRQRLIGSNDDQPEREGFSGWATRDSRFEFVAASTGMIYVVLQDAHDQGGPVHPYRLRMTR